MLGWTSRTKLYSRIRKIRTKFLLFILLPTLLVIVVAGVLSFILTEHSLTKQLKLLGAFAMQQATDEMEFGAMIGLNALRGLVAQERILSPTDKEREASFREVAKRLQIGPFFMGFPDGRFISGIDPSHIPKGYDPRLEEWYKRAVNSDEEQLTLPYESKLTKSKVFTVVTRVNNPDDSLKGVMGYEISTRAISWKMTGIKAIQEDNKIVFSMFFEDGTYLHHQNTNWTGKKLTDWNDQLHNEMWKAVQKGKTDWEGVGKTANGTYYASFKKLRSGPVYVVLEISREQALQPLWRIFYAFVVLGLLTLFVLTYILVSHARAITMPLEELSSAAVRLSKGDYDQKLPVTTRDELGKLTYAFNTMTQGLRQRDFIRNTFGRYMSEQVANRLLDSEGALKLGGETRELSILMSDLRGFTSRTADLPPPKVLALLNGYLANMVEILQDNGAIVNEIIGDGILAFYGAPDPVEDHPARAVACALKMQIAMDTINAGNRSQGLPVIEMGIGVNTGDVVVGNIGSERRAKYGIVGPQVNFTGRTESFTVGGQILITNATYERIKDIIEVRDELAVELKGVPGTMTLYDVIGIKGEYNIRLREAPDSPPSPLEQRIPITIHHIRDKAVVRSQFDAWITHLSERSAIIICHEPLFHTEDIRIDVMDDKREHAIGELYGRVASIGSTNGMNEATVLFSFVTSDMREILRNALTNAGNGPT